MGILGQAPQVPDRGHGVLWEISIRPAVFSYVAS